MDHPFQVGGYYHNPDYHRYVGIQRNDRGCEDQWYTEDFEPAGGPW